MSASEQHASTTVGIVLMKSEEADATVAYFTAECPQVRIQDRHTFYLCETEGMIRIPLAEVEEFLGKPLTMSRFLVVMSSYYGRARVEDDAFIITSEMSQLEPASS
ncbi:Methane monooxygenase regulatory protein B [Mycobacterium marinum]|uniref:MmoB/DmpM family protein n=1 Tax=Mycobacterium marinum TaxID=1781 RepID=UPI000358AA97|nr:MmoB/DmpM family protein [Mycobacterium marinum]AXN42075.1 Methane monooxygenase regulatory protein B [Mycobacterium marinum]AXN47544.1 Methane monooxygenase regulatory protein B [Mycobacterium marinum]EPQ72388.1 Methane monooxygenase regulatory protein B [Mycobacterium marinum str. Europe]RFZ05147.1 Methane monooxygenase regulatory protein B [Mycobacterium marinum]RFZ15578.1 Methane monooxygenase regulatory protein B [Mycobacterium marinum]